MSIALALDLGTTSTAAVAVDRDGQQVCAVRRDHAAGIDGLPDGHAEQSPQRHREVALAILKEVSQQLSETPHCLGLTGQMHSVLPVDAGRRPVGDLVTWQDRRANQPYGPSDRTYLDELLSQCDADDVSNSGCQLSPGYGAVSLFVLREQTTLPEQIDGIACLADWIAAELTDGPIRTDRSHAASLGIYNLRQDCWSESLAEACAVPPHWLPDVVAGGDPLGGLSSAVATATGLPEGLPVCAGIGDNQASVLGSVPQGEPSIQITIGTGGQINWPVENFVRVEGMDTRPLPPQRMMLVGAGLAGGDAYAWVNRLASSWLEAFGIRRDAEEVYDVLRRLAEDVPDDAGGLLCEPYFRGTRRVPLRRGTFTGVDTQNFTPGHVARAVLTGIARGFHECWETADEHRPQQVSRIIGCGNGFEQNALLGRIVAEMFSLPVFIPRHSEAAAYGAALLAGVKTGLWANLQEAGRAIELRPAGESDSTVTTPLAGEET